MGLKFVFEPKRWVDSHVSGGLELLDSFVSDTEASASKLINDFQKGVGDTGYENGDPGNPNWNRVHKGVDGGAWCLDTVFLKYYPTLYRASGFLTVYGAVEQLSVDYVTRLIKWGEIKKGNPTYLINCFEFLEKNFNAKIEHRATLNDMRLLRNSLAHCHGRFELSSPEANNDLRAYVENEKLLSIDSSSIEILDGYLKMSLGIFRDYFASVKNAFE